MSISDTHGPPPIHNNRSAVWDLVIADMQARDAEGRRKYGTPLQPFNGRDALVDAYQEALDLAVYLRQAIAERDAATDPALFADAPFYTVDKPASEPAKPAQEPGTVGPGDVWMSDAFLLAVTKRAPAPAPLCETCRGERTLKPCHNCLAWGRDTCVPPHACPPCPACGGNGVKP